ncbi:thioesterase [Deinococcus malanensis]|uniref:Thioesterase n=1 Tax=Deinococcus malanensis TaxID=1706855 RepID=A0ABQ2EPX7_9DEIO|nr:thioesterase family protein [Deinococcus malanensis]GGK16577.1 thioesterase [Deinococcus malanensis]
MTTFPGLDFPWEALPAERRHEMQRTVQASDLDDLDHVNNTVYLSWCEAVARAHALRLDMGTAALAALGAVPVARQHTITYLRPALLGEVLRVRTALLEHAGLRSVRGYTIDRLTGAEPQRLVECRTDWVWVDPVTGRPRRAPTDVATRFGF